MKKSPFTAPPDCMLDGEAYDRTFVMKVFYALACLLGAALPLSQFLPWLGEHGLALPLMLQQIQADRLSAFAWMDVLVSGAAVIAFVLVESHRIRMRHGWLALLGLCVGVSLALPLFLLLREQHLQRAIHQDPL